MKKILFLIVTMLFAACSSEAALSATPPSVNDPSSNDLTTAPSETSSTTQESSSSLNNMNISITVGSAKFTAVIEDSETGRAFVAKLPMTLDMNEHLGNEKYANGVSLPVNAKYYGTIDAGDLMLYGSDCIVLFYGSAGGYSYTPIGKLADTTGLAKALGTGKVKVTFSK